MNFGLQSTKYSNYNATLFLSLLNWKEIFLVSYDLLNQGQMHKFSIQPYRV